MSDEALAEMADFLVAFPGFTPEAYWRLTVRERAALVAAFNRHHKK